MVITYVCVFVGVKGGALLSVMYDYSRHRSSHQVTARIQLFQVSGCGQGVVVGGVNK